MKQILTTLLLVIAFAITAQAKSEPVKAYFALEPQITSQNLENEVKTGMRYEPGVQAVSVNRQQQVVTITFDPDAKEGQAAMADNRPLVKKLAIYAENVKNIKLHNVKIEGYEGERLRFANVGHFEED